MCPGLDELELAGGEGFEPPLSESESDVLPLDDPPVGDLLPLTLRVLRSASRLTQTDFLTLDLTGIASDETGFP